MTKEKISYIKLGAVDKMILHGGVFHADDVFCAIFGKLCNQSMNIERTTSRINLEDVDTCFRTLYADVGDGQFDHHSVTTEWKPGIPHCAATKMWEQFKDEICEYACFNSLIKVRDITNAHKLDIIHKTEKMFENYILKHIALQDNGQNTHEDMLITVIQSFQPNWNDAITMDEGFENCVSSLLPVVKNIFMRFASKITATEEVEARINNSDVKTTGIVILDNFVPWQGAVCAIPEALIVVFHDKERDQWNIQAVPEKPGSRVLRINLPARWCGVTKKEDAANIQPGMVFCHSAGFLAAFVDKQSAIAAANIAIDLGKPQRNLFSIFCG